MNTSSRSSRSSSPAEERRILESWQPEPLVPKLNQDLIDSRSYLLKPHIVKSKPGKFIILNDNLKCLNFATHNYLGLADDQRLESASKEALHKYGVGSCGPRAFYGTMDVHLKLEEELASFLNVQEAVLYSFGFSTIASAIPAYAKQTDTVFVDECCNFSIQQGLKISRSKLIKFKHNDMNHLNELIDLFQDEQMRKFGRLNKIRTFILVEGIYAKTGQLCPLRELIQLKKKHKIRLFIDESRSFGVLGPEGRGISEHFNVDINDVDLIMASLDNALCSYGGFCAGSSYIIDHQRLAGSGYCFSASLPPLQTRVALEALNIIRESPEIVSKAQELFKYANEVMDKKLTKLRNISHPLSPIKLLILNKSTSNSFNSNNDDSALIFTQPAAISDNGVESSQSSSKLYNYEEDERILSDICEKILINEQMALTVSRYMEDEEELSKPLASIRLIVSGCLGLVEIDRIVEALERYSTSR